MQGDGEEGDPLNGLPAIESKEADGGCKEAKQRRWIDMSACVLVGKIAGGSARRFKRVNQKE